MKFWFQTQLFTHILFDDFKEFEFFSILNLIDLDRRNSKQILLNLKLSNYDDQMKLCCSFNCQI